MQALKNKLSATIITIITNDALDRSSVFLLLFVSSSSSSWKESQTAIEITSSAKKADSEYNA